MLDATTNRSLMRACEARVCRRYGLTLGTPFITDMAQWQFRGDRRAALLGMWRTKPEFVQAAYLSWLSMWRDTMALSR